MTNDTLSGLVVAFTAWCEQERAKLGALDGYDYRSGEEHGLRRAQLEIERRAGTLRALTTDSGGTTALAGAGDGNMPLSPPAPELPSQAQEWHPIETVPIDGTEVDLWFEAGGTSWRMPGLWWRAGTWWRDEHRLYCSGAPTHWMPSPAPPQTSGQPQAQGWQPIDIRPQSGRKIVALFNDGSGATLFFVHDGGFLDVDGNDYEDINIENYSMWAYLPDGFQLWCENRANDPVQLPSGSSNEGA